MANPNNWLPELTPIEAYWYHRCPKGVLFEIARQFGMRMVGQFTTEAAFKAMQDEWDTLHWKRIVPQKPPGNTRQPTPAAQTRPLLRR
jgi:hypothetical protein